MNSVLPTRTLTPANRPTTRGMSGFTAPAETGLVATSKSVLRFAGRTSHGHYRLRARSVSRAEIFHDVLVSKDGQRVSCDCPACCYHNAADERGRLTVRRADVMAGRVPRCCWHLRRAARIAPLVVGGFVLSKEVSA